MTTTLRHTMATAQLNGITIAYDDVGNGPDTLLLVHGHPFDRTMWHPQLAALYGTGWRVVAPDLRGYGGTTVVPGHTRFATFAEDIAALLDHLGVGRVVLGGLSMGGQIVMEFCRLHPDRVRGILLAATFPQGETEAGKVSRTAMAERLRREGMARYADEVLPRMLSPYSITALPTVAAHVTAMMKGTDPEGAAAALLGRAERPDYRPILAGLDVPAAIVVGDHDAFTSAADARLMHELLRGSELVMPEGIGHMPNLESVTTFNEVLLRLLARTRAADRPVAREA